MKRSQPPQPNAQPERDAERGVSVDIAVAKAARDVAVRPAGPSWRRGKDEAGRAEIVARPRPLAPPLSVLEATGGYERLLVAALALVGVAPPAQPGQWPPPGLTSRLGRPCPPVAPTPSAPALNACSQRLLSTPALNACSQRLLDRGKPPKVALVAGMHTLLTILNALVKAPACWQELPASADT